MTAQESAPYALVTGGTRGIGRAICLELASLGYHVAFTYRSKVEYAESLLNEIKAISPKLCAKGYQVDMANTVDLQKTLDQILSECPGVEVLVNNAGISIDGLALRYKAEDFQTLFQTNVQSAFLTTQAVLRPMMKSKRGSILFISSVIGQMGNAGQVPYAATKAALLGMMKSLAREVGSRGIRVNAIAPGFIKTDMTEGLPEKSKESIVSQIPLGTLGEAVDIAKAVGFLVSDNARYITGQVVAINGGMYM